MPVSSFATLAGTPPREVPGSGGGIPGVPAWGQANHSFEVPGEVGLIVEAGLGGNRGDR
jgi:hypothetical protein